MRLVCKGEKERQKKGNHLSQSVPMPAENRSLLSVFHWHAGIVESHQVALIYCGHWGSSHSPVTTSLVSSLWYFQFLLSGFLHWTVECNQTFLACKDCRSCLMHSSICHPHLILMWDDHHVLSEHLISLWSGKWILLKGEYLSNVTSVFMTSADSCEASILLENLFQRYSFVVSHLLIWVSVTSESPSIQRWERGFLLTYVVIF